MNKLAVIALLLLTGAASAGAERVSVDDAWIRATVPGQKVAGAYMAIRTDFDGQLVAVASPRAARTEIHEMRMDGQIMRMRPVSAVPLTADKTTELKPGGLHIMLVNLAQPIRAGEKIPLELVIERDGKRARVPVMAEARSAVPVSRHDH